MELTNTFTVPKPVETVWAALLDVERVAPCMPGASVDKVDGNDIHGSVRVKLGPITMRYKGMMTFSEKDERAHRAVLTAKAQETRGGGSVSATVTAQLTGSGESTEVSVVTDLDVTGKPAQFGRGVMADVSKQLVGQFARNLARQLESEAPAPAAGTGTAVSTEAPAGAVSPAAAPTAATSPAPSPSWSPDDLADQSLNVMSLLREPARRLLPPVAAGLVLGLLLGRLTKRSSRRWPTAVAYLPTCPHNPRS
ncbi:SRPBCC family protein [Rhizomonospora bruguierae]|uniref:SRPBCC family protein n=1 Tax=Rhizomonospora bruguierae TaxID=1581705 RepID=UPI001BCE2943|nr:SRPBCC family protein [Micromonospora sp. NBRC 107566]